LNPTASGPAPPKNAATVQMLRRRDMRRRWCENAAGWCGSFHEKLLRAFAVPTPRIFMETMNMRCNWTKIGTWVAAFAVIGVVLGGIHRASQTDPTRAAESRSGIADLSPGEPP
jgi:hypothetical protein